MTSNISIGTASQSGSSTFISGTVSGLDTKALIENAVQANNVKADRLDVKISDNTKKAGAYDQLTNLSSAFQSSLSVLKGATSVSLDSNNIFESKAGTLTSNGVDPSTLVSVSVEEGATNGTNKIIVEQIAQSFSAISTSVADKDAAIGTSGDFTIGLDGRTDTTISIAAGDSLQNIADAINAQSTDTGVTASIVKVSETNFQLVLAGEDTNKNINVTTNSGSVLQDLGLVDGADTFVPAQIIQAAQGSEVTLNGITTTRDDNVYDDLIDGVEINLLDAEPGTTITLTIGNDVAAAKDAISNFVDSYNDLRNFILTNQTVNADGSIPEDAYLYSDSLLDTIALQLNSILTRAFGEGNVQTLRDLGIQLDDQNRLTIADVTKLDNALLNDFDDVKSLFSNSFTTDNPELGIIKNTSIQGALSFNLTIDVDEGGSGAILSVSANGDTNAFDISGQSLIGRAGTIYEGLTIAYVGTTDATISVDIGAGLSDRLFNSLEPYANSVDGLILKEIQRLQAENDEFAEDAAAIRARGETIREEQIQKYSRLEAQLSALESLKRTLDALFGNNDDD